MRPFAYERPESIEQAMTMLATSEATSPDIRPLAGGTDLLTLMKSDIVRPDTLIDLKRVAELDDRIETTPDGTTIGALTTLSQLEHDPTIQSSYGALAGSAGQAATPQLRNMATLGGNVLQRPRCWYFRDPEIACWLKGGDTCPAHDGENTHHAIFQESPCVAVHPSDSAAALIALDAEVLVRGSSGERTIPIGQFFTTPTDEYRRENVLAPGELILGFRLPTPASGTRSVYLKAMDRKVWAFALVGVAASVTVTGGIIGDARIVLGGVATVPHRLTQVEDAVRGQAPDDVVFARAAELGLDGARPLSHSGYKVDLAKALIQRALMAATVQRSMT